MGVALARTGLHDPRLLLRMQMPMWIDRVVKKRVVWDPGAPPLRAWTCAGLSCFLHHAPFGNVNGYVAVTRGHPWFLMHYDECPVRCGADYCDHRPESIIDVHGGITWSALYPDADHWTFGFDTGHFMDYVPGLRELQDGQTVWHEDAVQEEANHLAYQLAAHAELEAALQDMRRLATHTEEETSNGPDGPE